MTLAALLAASPAAGVSIDQLDPGRDWRIDRLRLRGNDAVSARAIRAEMLTRARPWYVVWRRRPVFDPGTFAADLERLRLLYRRRGYYHTRIAHDVESEPDDGRVRVTVSIDEGPPVRVAVVNVAFGGELPAPDAERALRGSLPLAAGAIFTESAYTASVAYVRRYYRERGYAQVRVDKRARVDLGHDTAEVAYQVGSGPPCVFGDVRDVEIHGVESVDEGVVRREVAFESGAAFDERLVERTRRNLEALKLFSAIDIAEEPREGRIDLRIAVKERPPREVRVGVGFDTEELVRGSAAWTHYNLLGGARQLQVSARLSVIHQTLAAGFLQPHFPLHAGRTNLLFSEGRQEEEPFTLDRTRVSPRIDWQVTSHLTAFVFHRFEYDVLLEVNRRIETSFPGIDPGDGFLSGAGVGAQWSALDNDLDPTTGWATTAAVESVGGLLGGDYSFLRTTWEGRAYRGLLGRLRGAARLRLGAADPVGSSREIPIFERFFSGGINSVRGYGRWRVGRIFGDPVGGRTRVEFTVELRHPITDRLSGVAFVDGGQVSVRSYVFPFDEMQYGAGAGLRYASPVGPIGLDLGFPTDAPEDDPRWRVHVSLGAAF